jgi:hypothetical protein
MHQVAVSFPPIKNQSATVLPPPPDGMYQLWLGSSSSFLPRQDGNIKSSTLL